MLEPGKLLFAGLNSTTIAATAHPYLVELKRLLERAGAPVNLTDVVQSVVWGKLLLNCAINPIAALLDITNGELLQHEAGLQLMAEVVAEVVLVAKAAGVLLPFPESEALNQALQAARLTAANYCSMVQDLRKNRTTEIAALNGAVVREGERLGLKLPVNRTLTNLITFKQTLHN
jgi:2-dehydropantoate 2-reductase